MPRLLLCPPDHYGIEYEINPWMDKTRKAVPGLPQKQWQSLHDRLQELGWEIEMVKPQPGLPDMVFTANAGLAVGQKFIRSNFRHKERQGEEEHFERWFAEHGYEILRLPE
jgi:N-dimethylarginine dimethylaminohydrolase